MKNKKDWYDKHLIIDGLDPVTADLLKGKIRERVQERFAKVQKKKGLKCQNQQ